MNGPPIDLEEAQARLLALAGPLPVERVDVPGALGRYLSEPLIARRTQPQADLSAMDGYAVSGDDLIGPWQVIGESAAGHPCSLQVGPMQAVRISTGAVVPMSADAVILQEDVDQTGDTITLSGDPPVPPGKHIRPRGLDFKEGSPILEAGTRIGPAQAALAISAGHRHLPVRRIPRIAVIDSGDELAVDPECCEPHQIPASNGLMLSAMISGMPCHTRQLGPVRDDMEAIADVLSRADDADIIVTSGGASVGDHDLMRPALENWGARIELWRVAIKPGKPLLIATRQGPYGRQLVLGLPGNPVSSHVTAYLFLLPLVRALLGAAHPLPQRFRTTVARPMGANSSRRTFVRGNWDGVCVTPQVIQDSAALAALAASNVLIDRAANAAAIAAGAEVFAYLLETGGIA